MLFDQLKPYLDQVTDQQERVLRYLYSERYTRPYLAAFMGISIQQVMVEEIAALRAILEAVTKKNKKKSTATAGVVGLKQERDSGAGPSNKQC